MSEFINNSKKRVEDLLDFSLKMMSGENGSLLIEKYQKVIDQVTPYDMLMLEDKQMQMGITPKAIKDDVEKVINVFFSKLANYNWKKPEEGTFLYYLMLENKAYEFKLNQVKKVIRENKDLDPADINSVKKNLLSMFNEFKEFESHYVKKENILFPYLEKKWNFYRPLNVMWSLHDDIRKGLKTIINLLESGNSSWQEIVKEIGSYFFLVFGMIQKENLIIYPVASETVSPEEWLRMHQQSFEYPFPFIEVPSKPEVEKSTGSNEESGITQTTDGMMFKTETGELDFKQILLLLNNLPVDVTFVDENNKVRYFSRPKDRFFPRSPAIIGRDVKNCHPPESVHIVERIVNAFRKGEKDTAKFWLQMKGKFILIQYFALRNSDNEYKGVLEVGQDITEIKTLEGQQTLLNWD